MKIGSPFYFKRFQIARHVGTVRRCAGMEHETDSSRSSSNNKRLYFSRLIWYSEGCGQRTVSFGGKKTDEPEGASSLLYYIPLLREPPDELMDRFSFYPEIQEFDAFGWPRVEKADQI